MIILCYSSFRPYIRSSRSFAISLALRDGSLAVHLALPHCRLRVTHSWYRQLKTCLATRISAGSAREATNALLECARGDG
jgi:hypothetical protein